LRFHFDGVSPPVGDTTFSPLSNPGLLSLAYEKFAAADDLFLSLVSFFWFQFLDVGVFPLFETVVSSPDGTVRLMPRNSLFPRSLDRYWLRPPDGWSPHPASP